MGGDGEELEHEDYIDGGPPDGCPEAAMGEEDGEDGIRFQDGLMAFLDFEFKPTNRIEGDFSINILVIAIVFLSLMAICI